MKVAETFETKFAGSIIAALSCFDRVIFKGYLPFGGDGHLNAFVDRVLRIPRKDFLPELERMSQQLVEHAQKMAKQAGAPYQYLQGKHSKEQLVDQIARDRGHPQGLLAVLCCQETCRTVKLRYGRTRPQLEFARRPQRVLYYYFLDPDFGRIHVRIQTWFPFTIQVYVNGRWVLDQVELSTDVIFRDAAALNPLYRRLLDHAAVNFSAQDILGFLGRRLHPRFDGEVVTECKKDQRSA